MAAAHEPIEAWLAEAARRYAGRAIVVGKGPSSAELDLAAYADHFVVALNEASLKIPAHAAFIIDEDILLSSGAEIIGRVSEALITPRVMHCPRLSVGGLTIYAPNPRSDPSAAWRSTQVHKHRTFNLATVDPDPRLGGTYAAYNFSGPTLVNLLARNGFRHIVLAGVDGGRHYASQFADVEHKKLRSIQQDYDVQFMELRAIRQAQRVSITSVRCPSAHVLIGAAPEQLLAEEVLRWSIDSRTFLDIDYCEARANHSALYSAGSVGTPFSLQRLYLPRLAQHRGRGLYLDSDMLVFRDVYEVFNTDMSGNVLVNCQPTLGRAPQFSVFLVDNARANWNPDELVQLLARGELSYGDVMHDFKFAQPKATLISQQWNSLESFEPGETGNIHFTDMDTQPWLSVFNPNADLWCQALFDALKERPTVGEAFARSLDMGWVRPSLRWQVEHQKADPWSLPRAVRRLDEGWLPPHISLRASKLPTPLRLLKWRLGSHWRRVRQSRGYQRLQRYRYALAKAAAWR